MSRPPWALLKELQEHFLLFKHHLGHLLSLLLTVIHQLLTHVIQHLAHHLGEFLAIFLAPFFVTFQLSIAYASERTCNGSTVIRVFDGSGFVSRC